MTDKPKLLVLAPAQVSGRIAAQAGAGAVLTLADPYEALIEMGKRPWPTVVLSAPLAELPAVARASRRLQKDARIVALCGSADEQEVQAIAPAVLDDYLIDPPTRGEVSNLLDRGPSAGPAVMDALSGAELAGLIEAARSAASLESAVAALVSARLGEPVVWADPAELPAGAESLLLVEDPPRALVRPDGSTSPEHREGTSAAQLLLAGLRQFLPALRATAHRTEVLRRLSITDDLTGLYNRRYFHQFASEVLIWSRQKGAGATLLLYDIDNFKRYNDEFGHPVGDEILREMAVLIKQITRSQDVVARVGGEEFAVLFWESEPPRAEGSKPVETPYALADRFRRAVVSHRFPALGPKAKGVLTISGGLATFPRDGTTVEELVRQADEALLAAKRSGKNAIRIIGPE
jgi:diguanylate cyclase (GGDEF)-like protein